MLVFKETTNPSPGAYIVLNGVNKFIDKNFKNYAAVKAAASKYNSSKDAEVRKQLLADIDALMDTKVVTYLQGFPQYSFDSVGRLYLDGINIPIPAKLTDHMKKAMEAGLDLEPLENFWKMLVLNPDPSVIEQLFGFLDNNGHPITTNGYFLAYKAVQKKKRYDKATGKEVKVIEYDEETGNVVKQPFTHEMIYTSIHSGPYGGTIKVGEPITMPREECDGNPNQTCSKGKMYAPLVSNN